MNIHLYEKQRLCWDVGCIYLHDDHSERKLEEAECLKHFLKVEA